jgi:hypothetical protein
VKPVTRRPLLKITPATNPVKAGTRPLHIPVAQHSVEENIGVKVNNLPQTLEEEVLLYKWLEQRGLTVRDLWLTGLAVACLFLSIILTMVLFGFGR